ncbi:50S ribosomal protein L30e [Nanoarchaeota archaeon]|nr:MAG: 50S ribosomal protein L30e [Nanoarchaeota archaeon]
MIDLKDALKDGKIILGTKETLKALREGKVDRIIIARDAKPEVKQIIEHNAKVAGVNVEIFDGTNKDLGVFCGVPFIVTVAAIVK